VDDFVKFGAENLEKYYQSNPSLVFQRGFPNLFELSTGILEGAFHLGCSRVEIEVCQGWHVVKGDFDWLSENLTNSETFFFSKMMPFPELDVNSVHFEFYLPIFCKHVLIFMNSVLCQVKGEVTLDSDFYKTLTSIPAGWRALAFKL
jgi:hypothetical protein